MRLTFAEIKNEIKRAMTEHGMPSGKAEICAQVHTESTYDGIYSHGTNRVPRFVDYLDKGWVDPNAELTLEKEFGALQIYNGHLGPGITNALSAVDKGIELARINGIGMVGIKNTTHWMRGGTYGLAAAEKGYATIMWTNTESCMPPWGAKECRLGNNPFVIAVPRKDKRTPIIFDMALSQYSYGKIDVMRLAGEQLSFPGGFDKQGHVTQDPAAILESERIMPVGFWKGSGLSFMLDLLGALLTNGYGAADMDAMGKGSCGGASQVMILFDPDKIIDRDAMEALVNKSIAHIKSAEPAEDSSGAAVPGEGVERFRKEHDEKGIFVDDSVWAQIKAL